MQETDRQSMWMRNWRRGLAVAFLFVLIAEWGSHSLAFAHSYSVDGDTVIHTQHGADDDLCRTMIRCPEGPRQEIPPPNVGHPIVQQNLFFSGLDVIRARPRFRKDPRFGRAKISGLFRAVAPPFHPPELS